MSALMYLSLLGAVATSARLVASDLWRRYAWFAIWTGANILKPAILDYMSRAHGNTSTEYVIAWRVCHSVSALLLIPAGIEAYCHIANDCPKIGNYGRFILLWSSIAAVLIALMPLGLESFPTISVGVGILVRSSAIAVGLGLVFGVSRIRSVPISERNNLVNHYWLLAVYCAGQAAGMTMLVYTGNRSWGALYMGAGAACWCLWPFLLTRKGEELGRLDFSDDDRLRIRAAVEGIPRVIKTIGERASAQPDRSRVRR